MTSVTLTFDLWPWPFAWTSRLSLVITPENFMMIWWWEHSQKGVTDGQTDRQTDGRTDGKYHSLSCLVAAKKNSYNFPRWPVGVKSYHVVLKLLCNHLRPVNKTGTRLEILQTAINTCLIINILTVIFYHYGSYEKKKKKIHCNKNYVTNWKMIILI